MCPILKNFSWKALRAALGISSGFEYTESSTAVDTLARLLKGLVLEVELLELNIGLGVLKMDGFVVELVLPNGAEFWKTDGALGLGCNLLRLKENVLSAADGWLKLLVEFDPKLGPLNWLAGKLFGGTRKSPDGNAGLAISTGMLENCWSDDWTGCVAKAGGLDNAFKSNLKVDDAAERLSAAISSVFCFWIIIFCK